MIGSIVAGDKRISKALSILLGPQFIKSHLGAEFDQRMVLRVALVKRLAWYIVWRFKSKERNKYHPCPLTGNPPPRKK